MIQLTAAERAEIARLRGEWRPDETADWTFDEVFRAGMMAMAKRLGIERLQAARDKFDLTDPWSCIELEDAAAELTDKAMDLAKPVNRAAPQSPPA